MEIKSLFDLSGKVAVVTGGADGIGKGCCEILASAGASVVVAKIPSRSMSAMSNASIASMCSLPCVCASSQYPKWANRATAAS